MKRWTLILAICLAAGSAAGAGAAQPRSLHVTRAWPLQVDGRGFYPRESVRVTVLMGAERRTTLARTTSRGAFTAGFQGLRLRACSTPLIITARGARGDVASAPRPLRECPPDGQS